MYRNLHKKDQFSIRDNKTGRVCGTGTEFVISNVTCVVREGGRQKVISSQSKNVHAFLKSYYYGECDIDTSELDEIYYNPYTLDSFINRNTGEKLSSISKVYFKHGKAWILEK